MTPIANPGHAMGIKILVSREGIATLSATPILARVGGARALLSPVFDPTLERNPCPLGSEHGGVQIAFDRGEWIVVDRRGLIDEAEVGSTAEHAFVGIAGRLAADPIIRKLLVRKAGPHGAEIPRGTTAIDGFTKVARSCLLQVSGNAKLLRRGSDQEALHHLRVGLRRLRAAFAAFGPILSREDIDRWKNEIRWLAAELDTARDLDVFIKSLGGSTAVIARDDAPAAALGERLLLAQAAAYALAFAAIGSDRFSIFLRDCTDWVDAAPGRLDDGTQATGLREGDASVLAAQTLARLHDQLRKAGRHLAMLDPAVRHQVRIKAKKLRYAAEFFGETFGKRVNQQRSRYIASLTKLQDTLGVLNDLVKARECAIAVVGRSTALAFLAGEIVGGRNREEPQLLADARRAYKQWSRAKQFWT